MILAEAANFARDLANEPANVLTPTEFAARAETMAREHGPGLPGASTATGRRSMGMGSFLGVARGQRAAAEVHRADVPGRRARRKPLGLVGKGITFDTGGISIKPAASMEEMKGDMSGGAAVIAAMGAIARLKPKINVTALVPATENMPGGNATKPGDVLRAMNGKTIEVINTDAEGRLILADALSYAMQARPVADRRRGDAHRRHLDRAGQRRVRRLLATTTRSPSASSGAARRRARSAGSCRCSASTRS